MISLTGSVLVYRNEIYQATSRKPPIIKGSGERLSDDALKQAATRLYPRYNVVNVRRGRNPGLAVDIWLRKGPKLKKRLFDPYTGSDMGDSVSQGFLLASKLLDLHDNLLAGSTGRKVNSYGALAALVLAFTGLLIWWPGIARWRRSLFLHRDVGWKRFVWDLHSAMGFWAFGFIVLLAVTGLYIGNPEPFQRFADWIEPPTDTNVGTRVVDGIMYWMAYLHFGRLGGRGISWCGRGACDDITKAVWAVFGLVPAGMFITGAIMWWNRVLNPRQAKANRFLHALKPMPSEEAKTADQTGLPPD